MERFGGSRSRVLTACCLAVLLLSVAGSGAVWAVEDAGSTGAAGGDIAGSALLTPDAGTPDRAVSNGSLESAAGQPRPDGFQQADQPEADNTITRIAVAENGSATWTLRIRTRLDAETRAEDYRAFQESFRENTSQYLGAFERRMTGVVSTADASFDREMQATDFQARTSIQELPQRWGVVTYEFTWRGFAAAGGDRLVVGDVFAGGFFIDDDDVLEIVVPPAYTIDAVDPAPAESTTDTVEWQGREDFADMRPRVVAVPAADNPDSTGSSGMPLLPVLGGVLVVLAVTAIGIAYRRTDSSGWITPTGGLFGSDSDSLDGGTTAAAGSPDQDATGAADDVVGDDLLTDEDRVEALLAEHGGRMKQGDIVDELGWSKSKGSRVLSAMADDRRVRKLRIGRENLIERREDTDAEDGGDSHDAR